MKTVNLNEKELLEIDGGVTIGGCIPPLGPGPYNPIPENNEF